MIDRRRFLRDTTLAAAAFALPAASYRRLAGSLEDLRVGVIGLRSRGWNHVDGFRAVRGVRVAALCDVDSGILGSRHEQSVKRGDSPAVHRDFRELLASREIDAVSIATPNHWHALMTIRALEAGKHVYCEKPTSHSVREGRVAADTAKRLGLVAAAGTQSRSNPGMREIVDFLHQGGLGRIKLVRGLCYKRRKSIGCVEGPQPIPAAIDYDLWCGPSPKTELRRASLHYDWHWIWNHGNGDLGNQGIHQMDIARWILGEKGLAPSTLSFGGRFGYVDDGQTPNTQVVIHAYPTAPLVFEVRGLPAKAGSDRMDDLLGASIGVIVEGEKGRAVIDSYGGGRILDPEGREVRRFLSGDDRHHYENFVAAVRAGRPADLHADLVEGHLSSALCHVGNVSHRLGDRVEGLKGLTQALAGNEVALEALTRIGRHLEANEVDLGSLRPTLGRRIEVDVATETAADGAAAALFAGSHRAPFELPDEKS